MTGALLRIDIRGRDGATLRDAWAAGPRTYLGLGVAGLPEPVHRSPGPGSPSVLTNMVAVDRAARGLDRRLHRPTSASTATPRIEATLPARGRLGRARQRGRRPHALPDVQLVVPGRQRPGQAARVHAAARLPALRREVQRRRGQGLRGVRAGMSDGTLATFTDADGVEIAYRTWLPDERREGDRAVAHGASEHSGRYDRFARSSPTAATPSRRRSPRPRGHRARSPASARPAPAGGTAWSTTSASWWRIARRTSATSVVLFGHSMGSFLAQLFVQRYGDEIDGLVLSGSSGGIDGARRHHRAARVVAERPGDEPAPIFGPLNAAFEPARTPFDWLSRDDAEVDKYIADPMCGDDAPLTMGFVVDMLRAPGRSVGPENERTPDRPARAAHHRRSRSGVRRRADGPRARSALPGERREGRHRRSTTRTPGTSCSTRPTATTSSPTSSTGSTASPPANLNCRCSSPLSGQEHRQFGCVGG